MSEKQILNALTRPRSANNKNSSERPVDALAIKKVNDSLTDNLKSRDASASKKGVMWDTLVPIFKMEI